MFLPGVADGGRCPLRDRVPDPDCAVAVGAPAAVLRHSAGTERKFQNGSQGEHGGSRLDFVDFHSGVPAVRPFAMSYLPNFHLPKQRQEEQTKSKSTKCSVKIHGYPVDLVTWVAIQLEFLGRLTDRLNRHPTGFYTGNAPK